MKRAIFALGAVIVYLIAANIYGPTWLAVWLLSWLEMSLKTLGILIQEFLPAVLRDYMGYSLPVRISLRLLVGVVVTVGVLAFLTKPVWAPLTFLFGGKGGKR